MPLWTVLHVLSPDGGWHNYIILSQKQRSCTCQATPIEIFLQVLHVQKFFWNPEMFLKGIFELFLKDHVTLKTGVMAAENSALP